MGVGIFIFGVIIEASFLGSPRREVERSIKIEAWLHDLVIIFCLSCIYIFWPVKKRKDLKNCRKWVGMETNSEGIRLTFRLQYRSGLFFGGQ